MGGLGNSGENRQNLGINFSAIGLAGYGINSGKIHFPCNLSVQLSTFFMVSFEKLQEGGLGSGSTLRT